MLTAFFYDQPITNWSSAKLADTARYGSFFRGMLERGVYLAPSQFEAGFLSTAHGQVEIDATLAAVSEALNEIR